MKKIILLLSCVLSTTLYTIDRDSIEELEQKKDRLINNNPQCAALIEYFDAKARLVNKLDPDKYIFSDFKNELQILFDNKKITEKELEEAHYCLLVARAVYCTKQKLEANTVSLTNAQNNYKTARK